MNERPRCQEPHYTATLPLLKAIPVSEKTQRFTGKDFVLPPNWKAMGGFESRNKFTASSEPDGLFAKLFPLRNSKYAKAALDALQQLAQLPLLIPILSPISFCEEAGVSGLIFPLGTVIGSDRFGKIYPEADWQRIDEVVRRYKLKPLSPYGGDKIVIIELNGKQYAVDPIEDSDYSILRYLTPIL